MSFRFTRFKGKRTLDKTISSLCVIVMCTPPTDINRRISKIILSKTSLASEPIE